MSTPMHNRRNAIPPRQGLYDPAFEHDACGVNFVCDLNGRASHNIVALGTAALENMQHRGATGAEANTGDGSGILIQVPDGFFRAVVDFELPAAGSYATGIAFLPQEDAEADRAQRAVERILDEEGLETIGWRDLPIDDSMLGESAKATRPTFRQIFISGHDADGAALSGLDLDRRLYFARKRIEHEIQLEAGPDHGNEAMGGSSEVHDGVYFPSLSSQTFVYKGMLTTPQLSQFFLDLDDERLESAIAIVHSRFSTNTFPSWPLAHPYRFVAHNGEINTVQGNRNWMRAREALLASDAFKGPMDRLFPICSPGASDTAGFDEALELLYLSGYSLPHAVQMMIPEPWEHHTTMPADRKAFYRYHSALMEPWDGPASIAFTDGKVIGAVLDRNGLRPSRYWVTDDDLVIMASEVGVVDVANSKIVEKGRLQPGRMFLIDLEQGRIIRDDELKQGLASAQPYEKWIRDHEISLDDLAARQPNPFDPTPLLLRQQAFGYTHEELKLLLAPMASTGKEAIGSMGTDTPIAVLSARPRLLFDYFQQLFAQVTNPPLDAIREALVTSVFTRVGPRHNPLDPKPQACAQIALEHPVITSEQLAQIVHIDEVGGPAGLHTKVISCLYKVDEGGAGLYDALERIRTEAQWAIDQKASILVLSDRGANETWAAVPSLLATAAVHHHLIRSQTRSKIGLVVETGDAREVHHIGLLLGYGAQAVNPYLAFETISDLCARGDYGLGDTTVATAHANYVKAVDAGLLKVMSKMGISTVASYTGSQIFEAIGLGNFVTMEYFTGTTSRLGGVDIDTLAEEIDRRHKVAFAFNKESRAHRSLDAGGEYQWRREGEHHLFNPETVFKLQHATRSGRMDVFREYTNLVNDQAQRLATLRGLFRFKTEERTPVPLDEVEPISEIVKRFSTGAMSYGSISAEAHETLAIAMNRIGAKSNTGEGGEDAERFVPDDNGDLRRSAIKQVASGRFGVTSEYLTNADDIQIKMAQGAKPGEGGQLPGHKVYPWIAKTRHSTPGVGLISPPPHHDIYSIEDLAQLIHDLKNANPSARVHVKLVAEVGVGTVAAGVSKAHSDVVLISGHDGGTGASPLTSLKHAGVPWELGLAETQQTLLLNNLRDRIVVQTDGQLKTGRDVMIAALLGADEFGFATAPLVVSGCIMMRVCHLDTCPVGVATQNPELRKKFTGTPEFVVNFFEFIAEEVRELLAELGFRTLEDAIGQVEVLDARGAIDHWKADGLDLTPILHVPQLREGAARSHRVPQDHGLDKALDNTLISLARAAIDEGTPVTIELPIRNVNRTVGTMLGHEITKKWGGAGLPENTVVVNFAGSAGNSFGAFVPTGVTLNLVGDANDYVGKGLSGGNISLRPPPDCPIVAEDNVIAGNVILYGATGGEVFVRGKVGERFCVRNSGAVAVVEGVGDHACEYMTGGVAVILGATGRNVAAGMSGGVAYVHDPFDQLSGNLNPEMVTLESLNDDDVEFLRDRLTRHRDLTESAVAERLLATWDDQPGANFHKIMPIAYKRVLEAAAAARASGEDEIEAIMGAAHG